MDCCRTAIRLGAEDVKVTVRSPFEEMKASDWEIEEAIDEGIPILENTSPKEFVVDDNGKLKGVKFEKVAPQYSDDGKRKMVPTGEEIVIECDDVLLAIGQDNAFDWIEKDIGMEFGEWDMPVVDKSTMLSDCSFTNRSKILSSSVSFNSNTASSWELCFSVETFFILARSFPEIISWSIRIFIKLISDSLLILIIIKLLVQ